MTAVLNAPTRLLLPLLVVLLFLSGVSALVYQVLWLRLLSLTFGVTTHAASTVLASFMGGLAIGSVVAGRLADRVERPLRLFGGVELLIGLCALATPAVLGRGARSLHRGVFTAAGLAGARHRRPARHVDRRVDRADIAHGRDDADRRQGRADRAREFWHQGRPVVRGATPPARLRAPWSPGSI